MIKRDSYMRIVNTPVSNEEIFKLHIGDMVSISGYIFCGRDAVLPQVVDLIKQGKEDKIGLSLKGGIVFHTAVSPAGIGPTSSNKLEIESSIEPLSKAGIKIHLGKGAITPETVQALNNNNSVYAVVPPVTALLSANILEKKCIAFPELGMEAFYLIKMKEFQALIAAAHGESIYD